jgi:hypothetical protein
MAWRRLVGRENRFVHACIAYAFWEILRRTSTELRRFVAHAQVALRLRHARTHKRTRLAEPAAYGVSHCLCHTGVAVRRKFAGLLAVRQRGKFSA